MYHKILVPLDGSKFSTGVLPYVRYLAAGLKTPVELLYVEDPASFAPYTAALSGREFLANIASSLSAVTEVRRTTEPGDTAKVIIDKASASPGTLVAMTTHGYSGAARWLLGSVAEKVSQGLTSHLMLVRPESANGEAALKTLLVPLDHSAAAETVLPTVVELGQLLNLEVLLIHVTRHVYAGPPEAFVPVFGAITNLKEVWEQDTAKANRYLRDKADQLRRQGLSRVSTRALSAGVDGAAGEIIDLAGKLPDCLIVMAPRGQSGFEQWLLGSVTKRVVQHSKKPVLVVPSAKRQA